jgi:hypothetical protein
MKDFVSHRISIRAVASISAMVLVWAIFVGPRGPWAGFLSVGALAALLVTTAVLLIGRKAPTISMARVIHDVDVESAAAPSSDGKG